MRISHLTLSCLFVFTPVLAFAQTAPFTDLPSTHPAYDAVMYLRDRGIIQGYADNTFKPDQKVNRAEAVKILVAPLVKPEELATYASASVFTDVAADAWYKSYVEAARQKLRIIDGPPAKTAFNGSKSVQKAEFLKMLPLSQGVDPVNTFAELQSPLAVDATNPNEWFFPYMRYGIASSMTMVGQDGLLSPAKELTRSEISLLMYRYLMFKEGRRTQALLSEAESEIVNVLQLLEINQVDQAMYASARSLVAARGALLSNPDAAIIKGALKISEGFHALVQAYQAGVAGNLPEVIRLAGVSWQLGESAKGFDANLSTLAGQMQSIASNMANEARKLQQQ